MRTIAVAIAIVSACFMQEVSGNFLSATPEIKKTAVTKEAELDAKLHMTEEKEEKTLPQAQDLTKEVKADEKVEEKTDIGDVAIHYVMEKLADKHSEFMVNLADTADAANKLNEVAAKDGASDEAKKASEKAEKDLEEAEDKAAQALADDEESEIDNEADEEDMDDEDAQAQDTKVERLAARTEELDKDAAKDGASDEAKKAAVQAEKNFEEAEAQAQAMEAKAGYGQPWLPAWREAMEAKAGWQADEDKKAGWQAEADKKEENEEDEKDQEAAEEAPDADKRNTLENRWSSAGAPMSSSEKKALGIGVNLLAKRAAKDGASNADKLMAETGKKAVEAASKQDQAMQAKIVSACACDFQSYACAYDCTATKAEVASPAGVDQPQIVGIGVPDTASGADAKP